MINSVVAILEFNCKILFLKRTEQDRTLPNVYCLPGGKVEENESLYEGLKREVFEETKIDLKICNDVRTVGRENFISPNGNQFVINFYKCSIYTADKFPEISISFEHSEYKWIDLKDIENENIGEVTKNFLLKYYNKINPKPKNLNNFKVNFLIDTGRVRSSSFVEFIRNPLIAEDLQINQEIIKKYKMSEKDFNKVSITIKEITKL